MAALELLDRFVEIGAQASPQAPEVGAAGPENALGIRVVRQGVQQMLEGEVGVPSRHGLAERNVENGFNRC